MAYQDTRRYTSYSKKTFRDKLLHPEEGIAVCYVVHPTTGERYLVLRPDHKISLFRKSAETVHETVMDSNWKDIRKIIATSMTKGA